MKVIKILILLCFYLSQTSAQQVNLSGNQYIEKYENSIDTCWSVILVKKGKKIWRRKNLSGFETHGFKLFRNCNYFLELDSGEKQLFRVLDVQKDTLTLQFNGMDGSNEIFKTHYSKLKFLYLNLPIGSSNLDRIGGKKDLSKFDFHFNYHVNRCYYESINSSYTLLNGKEVFLEPVLTGNGVKWFEYSDGKFLQYGGVVQIPEHANRELDTNYVKTPISILPPFDIAIDEVNGLAFGFAAFPSNHRNAIKINGLTFEVLTINYFSPIFLTFLHSDERAFNQLNQFGDTRVAINGVYISIPGSMSSANIKGVYFAGVQSDIDLLNGFSLTGINTVVNDWKGVLISGLRNQAKSGRGLQIGLFNSCDDFKGLQIGLWNKNNKRSLPFINWN